MPVTLIVTSPCGTKQWQRESDAVPNVGNGFTCRNSGSGEIAFCGIVSDVHWEARQSAEGTDLPGMIVSVWLNEVEAI